VIETYGLSKYFGGFAAVRDVTLQVETGQVLALLGPNGAGKTTTVRMLTSVLKPSTGWARVAGFDVVAQPNRVRAAVGVLTENHGFYVRMPAEEYLEFFGRLYGMDSTARQQRIHSLLEQFGLYTDRKRKVGEFSKGMRQKLALARSLVHNPPVLLLDEPTSAMDPESARLVRDAILTLRSEQRTVIICTHNLAEAEELADQIAIIRQGQIVALGNSASLKQAYLGPEEYEVRFAAPLDGRWADLPAGWQITARGPDWFRYQTRQPDQDNPRLLRHLMQQQLDVLSLQLVNRSLERVYLQAINAHDDTDVTHAG
jgi:ABC-2 type transport system ATP-binding protein